MIWFYIFTNLTKVYDGWNLDSSPLMEKSGYVATPFVISSSSNQVLIRFTSHSSIFIAGNSGFLAVYSTVWNYAAINFIQYFCVWFSLFTFAINIKLFSWLVFMYRFSNTIPYCYIDLDDKAHIYRFTGYVLLKLNLNKRLVRLTKHPTIAK